jgi:hypothetical protein
MIFLAFYFLSPYNDYFNHFENLAETYTDWSEKMYCSCFREKKIPNGDLESVVGGGGGGFVNPTFFKFP